jgi:hypothetical protein
MSLLQDGYGLFAVHDECSCSLSLGVSWVGSSGCVLDWMCIDLYRFFCAKGYRQEIATSARKVDPWEAGGINFKTIADLVSNCG